MPRARHGRKPRSGRKPDDRRNVRTETCADRPVFRPLIGMDKEDIVRISRKIGTFDTSILPYEDCCTVFTPRHPRTRPTLEKVIAAEAGLDREALIEQAWTSRFSVLVEQFEK